MVFLLLLVNGRKTAFGGHSVLDGDVVLTATTAMTYNNVYSCPRQETSCAEPAERKKKGCCCESNRISFLKKMLESTENARPLRKFSPRPGPSNSEPKLARTPKRVQRLEKTLFDGVAP